MKKNVMLRDLKDFIDKKGNKPILSCVHFSKDGSITATDSHVLVTIRDYHKLTEDFNLNLVYFNQDTDTYPDTEHLLQLNPGTVEYTIKGGTINSVVTWLKNHKKYNTHIKITMVDNKLVLSTDNDSIMLDGVHDTTEKFENTFVQGSYLYSALNIINDYATGEDVELSWWGPFRPLQISALNITTLVTPLRVF